MAREQQLIPEVDEPTVYLKPMTAGREVVEDYGHLGLTLRQHPLAFLRTALSSETYQTCRTATDARDGRFLKAAGLVLIRQMPASAKGVMFITIEDETGIANLVIWPTLYEKQRRTILGASMLGVDGRIQREGEVVHLIAYKVFDLTPQLSSLGQQDMPFRCPTAAAMKAPEDHRRIRAPARPTGPATSTIPTSISTRSSRRRATSADGIEKRPGPYPVHDRPRSSRRTAAVLLIDRRRQTMDLRAAWRQRPILSRGVAIATGSGGS